MRAQPFPPHSPEPCVPGLERPKPASLRTPHYPQPSLVRTKPITSCSAVQKSILCTRTHLQNLERYPHDREHPVGRVKPRLAQVCVPAGGEGRDFHGKTRNKSQRRWSRWKLGGRDSGIGCRAGRRLGGAAGGAANHDHNDRYSMYEQLHLLLTFTTDGRHSAATYSTAASQPQAQWTDPRPQPQPKGQATPNLSAQH